MACCLEVGIGCFFCCGSAGELLPLTVNEDGYRRAVCGRLVWLGLRNDIIRVGYELAHFRKCRLPLMFQDQLFFFAYGRRFHSKKMGVALILAQ